MSKDVFGFDVNFLKQVKTLFKETNIEEVEIEEGENQYLRVSRRKPAPVVQTVSAPLIQQPVTVQQQPAQPAQSAEKAVTPQAAPKAEKSPYEDETKYAKIKSPIVGTYYEAASPGAPAFVKTGDSVNPDTVVCIIEAMKVMNEIRSEVKGKIVQMNKQNGASVQANEVLFIIEK